MRSLATSEEERKLAEEVADSLTNFEHDESTFGAPSAHAGAWASAVRMINAQTGATLCNYELPEGEAAFSVELVQFRSQQDASFVLVGCGVGLQLKPRRHAGGCIYTFLLSSNGHRFDFIHRTPTNEVVNAIHEFRGMALAGIGSKLRLFDFGKKKLLAKCENRQIPVQVVDIRSMGQRIVVSDINESIHFLRYRKHVSCILSLYLYNIF